MSIKAQIITIVVWLMQYVSCICKTGQFDGGAFRVNYWKNGAPHMDSKGTVPTTTPYLKRISQSINFPDANSFQSMEGSDILKIQTTEFAVDFYGVLTIAKAGDYEFFLATDDGGRIWIDGPSPLNYDDASLVVKNWGYHPYSESTGKITLTAGKHKMYGMMYQGHGPCALVFKYKGPDTSDTFVPVQSSWFPSFVISYSATPKPLI